MSHAPICRGIITPLRFVQLGVGEVGQVNSEDVRESCQVDHYVAELGLDPVTCHWVVHNLLGLLSGEPLELGGELTRFADKSHDEVLGRMELLPVALPCELPQPCRKVSARMHDWRLASQPR